MKKLEKQEEIQQKRGLIDEIDNQIITLLSKRFSICEQIAHHKRKSFTPIKQRKREHELFQARKEKALKLGINPKFTKALFQLIIKHSRTIQKESEDL